MSGRKLSLRHSGDRRAAPRLALVVLLGSALAGCGGVLDPHGPVGAAERTILFNALAIMLAIVIPTIIATLAFAWWFRASNTRARYRPDFVYSGQIELIVWSIPTLVILFLGGVIWIGSRDLDPGKPLASSEKTLEVQVVSLDWKWLFIYPDQKVATVNELVVPVSTPVHFTLTAGSVLNAFFVPQLGSMIYTMYGMSTNLHLQSDKIGETEGLSAMFSGDGFPGMRFKVRTMERAAFDAWVADAQQKPDAIDKAAYAELAKQSANLPPATYRLGDPDLFQAVVTRELSPGPGPQQGRGGPDVSPRPGG